MSNGMEGAQDREGPGDVEPNQFCTFACQCQRDEQYCWDVVNDSNNFGLFMNHCGVVVLLQGTGECMKNWVSDMDEA